MKSLKLAIMIVAMSLPLAGYSYPVEPRFSFFIGPQLGKIKDFGTIVGPTFSVQYEGHSGFGGMASLTSMSNDPSIYYYRCRCECSYRHRNSSHPYGERACDACRRCDYNSLYERFKHPLALYDSLLVGPTYQITESLGIFGLGGVSRNIILTKSKQQKLENSMSKKHYLSKNFAYAVGVNYTLPNGILVSVGREGSQAFFNGENHDVSSLFLKGGIHF